MKRLNRTYLLISYTRRQGQYRALNGWRERGWDNFFNKKISLMGVRNVFRWGNKASANYGVRRYAVQFIAASLWFHLNHQAIPFYAIFYKACNAIRRCTRLHRITSHNATPINNYLLNHNLINFCV